MVPSGRWRTELFLPWQAAFPTRTLSTCASSSRVLSSSSSDAAIPASDGPTILHVRHEPLDRRVLAGVEQHLTRIVSGSRSTGGAGLCASGGGGQREGSAW